MSLAIRRNVENEKKNWKTRKHDWREYWENYSLDNFYFDWDWGSIFVSYKIDIIK
jgi:hypothetical protein